MDNRGAFEWIERDDSEEHTFRQVGVGEREREGGGNKAAETSN